MKNKLIVFLIIAFSAVIYFNSLENSFVWDDYVLVADNKFIQSWTNLPKIFSRQYLADYSSSGRMDQFIRQIGSGEISYRPVVTISYFLDYWIWKLDPFGFHLTNLLLHISNCLLLYFFFYAIADNRKTAFLAAAFFAAHPVNSEAVCNIHFREDLLVLFFCLLAFLSYVNFRRYPGRKKYFIYGFSILSFMLALFSKEMSISLPLLFLLYDYFFVKKAEKEKKSFIRPVHWGYFAVLLFYSWIRFGVFNNINKENIVPLFNDFSVRLLTMIKVFAIYIRWMVFPAGIAPTLPEDFSLITKSFSDLALMFSIGVLAAYFAVMIMTIKKKNVLASFGMLWIIIGLLPVSNIIYPIANYIAARYLYLSMAGYCFLLAHILISLGGAGWFVRWKLDLAKYLAALILISYSAITIYSNMGWKDDNTLWSRMVNRYPRSAVAHSALAKAYRLKGLLYPAMEQYRAAIDLDPAYARDHNDLGACYYEKNMLDEAEMEFRKALELDAGLLDAYNNLGIIAGIKGSYDESVRWFEKAIEIDENFIQAYDNLAVTYMNMGYPDKAQAIRNKARRLSSG